MYYYSKEKLGAEEWVLMLSFDMSIYINIHRWAYGLHMQGIWGGIQKL